MLALSPVCKDFIMSRVLRVFVSVGAWSGFVGALIGVAGCAAARPAITTLAEQPTPPSQGGSGPGVADLTALQVGYPEVPSLSPDGSVLVFSWAGDLWSVPSTGGDAARLTAHPADERRSSFSPDGSMLAFESDRDGSLDLYVMPVVKGGGGGLIPGTARRVTTTDRTLALSGFSADGKALLFAATLEPGIHRMPRMHRAELTGPITRLTDAYGRSPRQAADASRVVFSRGGAWINRPKYRGSSSADVFELKPDGSFRQLTTDAANDLSPWPLPDGSTLFISSRDGQNNLWLLPPGSGGAGAGEPRQLTRFAPTGEQVTIAHGVRDLAVSADGRVAAFCVWDRLYRLELSQPGAVPVALDVRAGADMASVETLRQSADKEASEAVLSPDGKSVALVARGEIFVRATAEGFPTRRVTNTPGRERQIRWSPDGSKLYFVSDDWGLAGFAPSDATGVQAIYAATVALDREQLKPKPAKDETAPDEAKKDEVKKDEPKAEEPADAKPDSDKADPEKDRADKDKPDPKKPKKPDPGKRWQDALKFTITPVVAGIGNDAGAPVPSPDGKSLLYVKGRGDLVLRDLATGADRTLFTGWNAPEALWAPDSHHIIYEVQDLDFNSDIWLLDTAPSTDATSPAPAAAPRPTGPINLTRHPDLDTSPRLSADGKILTFLSDRAGENFEFDVYQLSLDKAIDAMTAYQRDEYYKKAAEAAGKRKPLELPSPPDHPETKPADPASPKPDADKPAVEKPKDEGPKDQAKDKPKPKKPEPLIFDSDDAYLRVRRITSLPGSEGNLAVTPGAERIIYTAQIDSEPALVSVDFKNADRKTLQAGAVSDVSVSLTGDRVAFIRQGQASTVPKAGGKADPLPLDAPMVVDAGLQQRQKFLEAARIIGEGFYHPTLKGLDWKGLTRRYLSLAERTRSTVAFNNVVESLFGELDGSHLGIAGGPRFSSPPLNTGFLGVRTVPVPGGLKVVHVTRATPAEDKDSRILPGEVIVSIDGVPLAPSPTAQPTIDLDAALAGRAGKEVLVEVLASASPQTDPPASDTTPATQTRTLLMVPLSIGAYDAKRYLDEVLDRRELVEKLSGGKLGYLHIRGMSEPSVRDFERDLYAAASGKQGLLIDVRDNGGGSTADILLSSLTAPSHAWTVPRGADPASIPHDAYPRDRRLIYSWSRPLSVLINQNSFSNAEIFAHAIRTTKRGKLVGAPTAGGVISTGSATLIDGTTVRTPFRGWYLPDGTDMENHGAQPDLGVVQTPEAEAAGTDPQLEAAVKELLERAPAKEP